MDRPEIHLDHNATTPVAPEVAAAMWPHLTEEFGNPSSSSPQGRRARAAVDGARERVAALIGAHPSEIVFSSGGTEANNLAIRGTAALAPSKVAVTSSVEHPATVEPLAHLERMHGWQVHRLPVDGSARVRMPEFPAGPLGLGTLILAQNETGTLQPLAEFAAAVRERGGVVHADAAQAVGKVPVSVEDLAVDLLSIARHKVYAPKGVGALYVRRGTQLSPVLRGAGQEGGLRPGTENVASIVGLGAAAELALELLDTEPGRQAELRDRLWEGLRGRFPDLVRITPVTGALPNTLLVALPGRPGVDVLAARTRVTVSTGSACHAGVHTPSATLVAAGVAEQVAVGALRLSLGRSTTAADVEVAIEDLARAAAASA